MLTQSRDYEIVEFVQNLLTHARVVTGNKATAGTAVRQALRANSRNDAGRIQHDLATRVLQHVCRYTSETAPENDIDFPEGRAPSWFVELDRCGREILSLNTLFNLDPETISGVTGRPVSIVETVLRRIHGRVAEVAAHGEDQSASPLGTLFSTSH
ncbi:hypothetical protein [Roseibium sp. RKSG952]|uniref:hypothetical protein n=1 Tax=Roseibium sp. RKSG952 TaxID=2529384 RepID=UPI0012BD3B04|nr:hypothetical protein [Roseibium sp. RKSG952]MTH95398.1 hypothetical protein [Roseibium sp. RKSG952]